MDALSQSWIALGRKFGKLLLTVFLAAICLLLVGRNGVGMATLSISAAGTACDPFPFVYTAEVLFGNFAKARPNSCYPVDEAARFDLIITDPSNHYTSKWCNKPSNAFQAIKELNPRTKIMLFRMGPGQYITAYWGQTGDGWDWIKQNHGKGTTDRWTALGVFSADYLVALPYPVERAMEIGNPNWQEYWIRRNYEDIWVNFINNMKGTHTDGIIADGMQYSVSWANRWCAESSYNNGSCGQLDHPASYYQNGAYNHTLWRQHYHEFLEQAVPYFRQRNLAFGVNAWRVDNPTQDALYQRLGLLAMEECGFLCTGSTQLNQWEKKLQALQNARTSSIVSMNLPPGYSENNPGGAMDNTYCADGVCQTGWKWLWYSLGSYLLGYEPQRQNAYFYFSLWAYRGTFWFDEYDPRHLHLGLPRQSAEKLSNGLWLREFERGWVVVNPTLQAKTVRVPRDKARLLEHENFKEPERASVGEQFAIAPLVGVILLRDPQPSPRSCTYLPLLTR